MYWNNPHSMKRGTATTFEGQQSPQPNQLVLNRQLNYPAFWDGGQVSLRLSGLTNPTAFWWSPIFDLRPDLPFQSQSDQASVPVYRSKTGDWGSLWIMFDGIDESVDGRVLAQGLTVTVQEAVSPIDPSRLRIIEDPVNVTQDFSTNQDLNPTQQSTGTLFKFSPATNVDPIRYWQVRFNFSWNRTFTTNRTYRVQSAYY